MAIICPSYGLLFIMTPRTACTATGKLLLDQLDGEWIPKEDFTSSIDNSRVPKKHSTLNQLLDNKVLTQERLKKLLSFTTIRNPFDSLVSLYVKMRTTYQPLLDEPDSWVYKVPNYVENMNFCKRHTFEEWIFKQYKPSQLGKILRRRQSNLYGKFTDGVDLIIRFENLQNDFQDILKKVDAPANLVIPDFNKTKEKSLSYREYYTPKSREVVEYVFQQELKKFNYQF